MSSDIELRVRFFSNFLTDAITPRLLSRNFVTVKKRILCCSDNGHVYLGGLVEKHHNKALTSLRGPVMRANQHVWNLRSSLLGALFGMASSKCKSSSRLLQFGHSTQHRRRSSKGSTICIHSECYVSSSTRERGYEQRRENLHASLSFGYG